MDTEAVKKKQITCRALDFLAKRQLVSCRDFARYMRADKKQYQILIDILEKDGQIARTQYKARNGRRVEALQFLP